MFERVRAGKTLGASARAHQLLTWLAGPPTSAKPVRLMTVSTTVLPFEIKYSSTGPEKSSPPVYRVITCRPIPTHGSLHIIGVMQPAPGMTGAALTFPINVSRVKALGRTQTLYRISENSGSWAPVLASWIA